MSILDLHADEQVQASLNTAPAPVAPPAKFSAWSAIPRAIGVAAGEVGASAADLVNAARVFRDTPSREIAASGLPTSAYSSELGDTVRSYWNDFKPDPNTATTAEQVLFGFSRGLAKVVPATIAAGPVGAIVAGIEEGMTVSDELRRKGVGADARTKAGMIQGAGLASAALPLLGTTLAETAALYVAGGPGGFMAQQALTRQILRDAGHDQIAAGYDPFDPVGLAVASLIPAGFTAYGLRGQVKAARAKAAADFNAGPVPSEPTPVAAAVADAYKPAPPRIPPEVVDAAMVQNTRDFAAAQAVSSGKIDPMSGKTITRAQEADAPPADGFSRLYHGGTARHGGGSFAEVPSGGPFDGFFTHTTRESSWGAHGDGANYFADIPDSKLLTNYALNYEIPYEDSLAAFTKVTGIKEGDDNFDSAWKAVIEDGGNAHAEDAGFSDPILDDAGWIAQKLRGQVAKELGFHAVEMSDEHGTSWLVVPGVPLTRVMDKAEADPSPRAATADVTSKPAAEAGDPIAKLNEPADAKPKPAADPIMSTVAARVADLESAAPDMVVRIADDGKHVTLADDLAEVRRIAAEGTDDSLGTLDADLMRVAVECALSTGG